MSELDRKIVRGSAWLALSYGGGQVVSLVTTAVLARFLVPAQFGLVALASLVIVAATTVQESGLGLAIIHKRDEVQRSAGTTFVFSVAMGVVLYVAAFLVAPLAAHVFREPDLTLVLRVLALMLIPRGLGMVAGVLIERELRFAARAKGELTAVGLQALTAIPLAVAGAGVWSLVAGQLVASGVTAVVFWLVAPFRPSPRLFSWPLLRELGRFGRHVTAANLLGLVDQNVDNATVGRLLGATDLGLYNLAWRLSNLPATGIGFIVGRVMFPAYATMQQDRDAFQAAFLTNTRRVALVSLPIGIGILIGAEPIVVGIFGANWQGAAAPLRILALFGIARAFSGTTGAVFQAAGRPKVLVWLNLLHLTVLCALLLVLTPPFGLEGTAVAVTLAAVASMVPAYRGALRILHLPLGELAASLERPVACSIPLVLVLVAVMVSSQGTPAAERLAMLVGAGGLVYAGAVVSLARGEVKAIAAALRS
jgi:O-antigen/teichoic acid export membrane protein